MKINDKLNIVIPLEDSEGRKYYVHSTPFSREAFEANYLLLSQAFSLMVEQGIQVTAGPRVAALVLKDLAEKQNRREDYDAIMMEIRRITNVIKAKPDGWESLPLASALSRKVVTEVEVKDVESLLVFFILVSAIMTEKRLTSSLIFMNGLWGTENTSLKCSAFTASLPVLTEDESSGETAAE